jgi:small GTP-binding protein
VSADAAVQERLGELVGELLTLVDGIVPASARLDLEEGRRRLEDARVNLVVLGEFKRGKSTLVNALINTDVVPTGVLPLTAAVTVVRHGTTPRLVVSFEDGGRQEVALAQIGDFATETGNPGNRRHVRLLTVELPVPLLAEGVQLVDTPGIGSVYAHNTETALGFLGQVDAALFTLAADQPLSGVEEQLIRDAAERVPRIFFALNKVDHLSEREREETVAFVRERLRALLAGEPELYPLSARSGEGLEALRRRLEQFAVRERKGVLARSVRSLAAAFAAEAVQAVRFEAHTVELPLNELEQKLSEFRERSAELARTREEAAQLLHQAALRLIAETVNEPLLTLANREGPKLAEALQTSVTDLGKIAPRALAERLDAWTERTIRDRFDRLAEEYEQRIAHELAGLHERYAERVDRILGELDDATAEVFGARAGRRAPESACGARRGSRSSCMTSSGRCSTSSLRLPPPPPPARSAAGSSCTKPRSGCGCCSTATPAGSAPTSPSGSRRACATTSASSRSSSARRSPPWKPPLSAQATSSEAAASMSPPGSTSYGESSGASLSSTPSSPTATEPRPAPPIAHRMHRASTLSVAMKPASTPHWRLMASTGLER